MQYSLRWILVATAYLALVAAALTQEAWFLADMLFAASLLAVAYAVVVICYGRGNRQAGAIGFIAASAGFLLCLQLGGSEIVPTTRLVGAAGFAPPGTDAWWQANRSIAVFSPGGPGYVVGDAPGYYDEAGRLLNAELYHKSDPSFHQRAANAVAMMAFGLMGGAIGALAYRAA